MKKEWKTFLKGLNFRVEFLHRDEMAVRYPAVGVPLPAVFKKTDQGINLVLDAGEIFSCRDLEELMDLLTYKLKHAGVMRVTH